MAVKIKLQRLGKIRAPYYRIIVADARNRRDGKAIETIGKYHPKSEPSFIEVDSDRAQYWLGVGAQPTEPVQRILEITGDWQKYKGLPGQEGTLRGPEPKPSKEELFNAALAEAGDAPTGEGTSAKKKAPKKAPKKAEEPKAEKAEAEDAKTEDAKTEDEAGKAEPAGDEA
ncbi:MAG: 30S ribosomal protein S16 [Actinophytocola sp.]|nr:30S ribosomal protein S16 [Actinophytocola sp.]